MVSHMQHSTIEALQVLLAARIPIVLWGDPGTGKTETIQRLAEEAGWHTEVVMASVHDPTDIGGLPVHRDGGVELEPPLWAKRVAEHKGTSLVFFDEVNTASPATQNALMHVVLGRRVAQYELGDDVLFMAAANPPEQNAGAWDLTAPLANRFAHLRWPIEFESWREGYLGGWPTPKPLTVDKPNNSSLMRYRSLQIAYVKRFPNQLCRVPSDDTAASTGWPSPRTWERLAVCMAISEQTGVSDDANALIAEALVGTATATEFLSFVRNLDIPDPEDLLADPSSLVLPEKSDQQFACLEALAAAVLADTTAARWTAGFKVCIEAASQGSPDIAAATARQLVKCRPGNTRLPKGFEVFNDILAAVVFEGVDDG